MCPKNRYFWTRYWDVSKSWTYRQALALTEGGKKAKSISVFAVLLGAGTLPDAAIVEIGRICGTETFRARMPQVFGSNRAHRGAAENEPGAPIIVGCR